MSGMINRVVMFLDKALESVSGAESEFVDNRYNNCAIRAYYAIFQAAVHALRLASGPRGHSRAEKVLDKTAELPNIDNNRGYAFR